MSKLIKVGDTVKVINDAGINKVDKHKYIGQEFEVYNTTLDGKFILEGLFLKWEDNNLEVIKSVSTKESALKIVNRDLNGIKKEIERLNKEVQRLEQMKEEIMSKPD
jgi:hypothetical protein